MPPTDPDRRDGRPAEDRAGRAAPLARAVRERAARDAVRLVRAELADRVARSAADGGSRDGPGTGSSR